MQHTQWSSLESSTYWKEQRTVADPSLPVESCKTSRTPARSLYGEQHDYRCIAPPCTATERQTRILNEAGQRRSVAEASVREKTAA
eukprot:6192817-Pleurochrysis_carterae.AAC.2